MLAQDTADENHQLELAGLKNTFSGGATDIDVDAVSVTGNPLKHLAGSWPEDRPSAIGAFAMGAENGSYAFGGGTKLHLLDDKLRVQVGAGYISGSIETRARFVIPEGNSLDPSLARGRALRQWRGRFQPPGMIVPKPLFSTRCNQMLRP